MGESFYFFVLFVGILLLVYWGYRKLKANCDSVSGHEALNMNDDFYHTPASGDTIAAIRDKRDGVVPVKPVLDHDPNKLVATHFGRPEGKFNRDKPVVPVAVKPEQPVEWESNRTPRQNRGFMREYPKPPPANDTTDSGDSD